MQRKQQQKKIQQPIKGQHKPDAVDQIRRRQMKIQNSGRRKQQPDQMRAGEPFWIHHPLLLLLLGGGAISLTALAYYHAVNTTSMTPHNYVPATGSSRPTGGNPRKPSVVTEATLFKPAEKVQPAVKPINVNAVVARKAPAIAQPIKKANANLSNSTAIIQCIIQLLSHKSNLLELHRRIEQTNTHGLNEKFNLHEMQLPHVKWGLDNDRVSVTATQITPIHYAFLTGRADVFASLLNAGVELHDTFKLEFHTTTDEDRESMTVETTLHDIIYQSPYHPLLQQLCTRALIHELFITYLTRKDFDRAAKMINHNFSLVHERAMRWGEKINKGQASTMLSMLPSPEYIQLALGDLRKGYEELLLNIHFEYWYLKSTVTERRYKPDALDAIKKQLTSHTDCFHSLLTNVNPTIKRDEYFDRKAARQIILFHAYPNLDFKNVYLDNIRTKVYEAYLKHYQGQLPPESHATLRVRLEILYDLADRLPNQSYLEALAGFIAMQMPDFSGKHPEDIALHAQSHILNSHRPLSTLIVKQTLQRMMNHLDTVTAAEDRQIAFNRP